jgi:hypothetical protein
MSRFLESLLKKKVALTLDMGERPDKDTYLMLMEVNYRISAFETIQCLYTASKKMAYTDSVGHYKLFDAYVTMLMGERNDSPKDDAGYPWPEMLAKRDTSYKMLKDVVDNYRQKFRNDAPTNPCDYIDAITSTMNTFLTAWLAHRNTYIKL